jgi:CHAD domain-containing protein
MAFCFKQKESVPKAIRRLGCERIEDAIQCLKNYQEAEAIHCARKDIKKVRAVLRLVRTQIDRKEFRALKKLLRETAKPLGQVRDAHVNVKTWNALKRHFKGQPGPQPFLRIGVELSERLDDEMNRFSKRNTAKALERGMRCIAKRLKGIDVQGKGWKALGPGVKAAYADGQSAYQAVQKNPSPEDFHEWRKHAKDLWYQVTLLRRTWPEQIDAISRDLEMLEENLGNDHDLVMLQEAIRKIGAGNDRLDNLEKLSTLIDKRQRELRAASLALGAQFYAEKPSTFCKRLAGYWKIWRKEKGPRIGLSNQFHNKRLILKNKGVSQRSFAAE